MNWRKQLQAHLGEAIRDQTRLVVALVSDAKRERDSAGLLNAYDVDAVFDRIEQRITNARRIWEEHSGGGDV